MNTEAIASEIVDIRNRLAEIDRRLEGGSDADVDDERTRLEDRMRHLQDELTAKGSLDERRRQTQADTVHYVPPL